MKSCLAQVLFHYCLTPQTTTGVSPTELLLGQRPRSRLDLSKPHTAEQVEKKQSQPKEHHDSRSRERHLEIGTNVLILYEPTIMVIVGYLVLSRRELDLSHSKSN